MQVVYASHAPIRTRSADSRPAEEGFKQALSEWARHRLGIQIEQWEQGTAASRDSRAEWATLSGDAGRLVRVAAVHPDSSAPLTWHIVVWLGLVAEDAWVRVRVGLAPRREGVVIDPNVSVGAPRFLRSLADEFDMLIDGRAIGSWWQITEQQVPAYLWFLESPERHLPIVAVTKPPQSAPFIAPERLAGRLTGVAHVVGVEPAATYEISDAITPTRSVFGGAVRIYWPGFKRVASPYSHPLFMPRGQYLGSDAFADDLAARLGRAAGLFLGPPALEAALRREVIDKGAEEARRKQVERQQRQLEAKQKSDGGLTAEEFEAFSKDFEEEAARRAELEERVDELELELEEERQLRIAQETAQREAWQAIAAGTSLPTPATAQEKIEDRMPTTVREAVEIASERCPDLIFTQSAFESAEESQFNSPEDVLGDLLLLQDVAAQWAAGTMNGDFRNAFSGRHSNFRSGISQTASTQYSGDYTINCGGRIVQLGPHLCRGGVGAPSTILRIYWFKDDEHKNLVVGHVSKKLRDVSNSD